MIRQFQEEIQRLKQQLEQAETVDGVPVDGEMKVIQVEKVVKI